MKKTALAAALAIAATTASAGTAFITADHVYDDAATRTRSTVTEVATGAAFGTKVGTVDGAIVARRTSTTRTDEALGFEVGYSNGLKVGQVTVKGRAAYGRLNQVATGNNAYYSLGAEASLPVAPNATAFAGYRHRNGLNSATTDAANRFSTGIDLQLSKTVGARIGFVHDRAGATVANGITTALTYGF